MKNVNTKLKHIAMTGLVAFNIALAGGVIGGYLTHQWDTKANSKTEQAVQQALKSAPVAQASVQGK